MNVIRPFVLIDFTKTNRYGYKVDKASFSMDAFKKNPVMLFMHQRGNVCGKWEDIKLSDNTLTAMPVFDEGNETGLVLKGQVERGFLRAASLAFGGAYYVKDEILYDAEVLETSIVDVPAYRESLMKNRYDNTIYYNSIHGLELNKMEDKKDQELTQQVQALEKENKELKNALVSNVLASEGVSEDSIQAKAYASLDAKDLLVLGVKAQEKETKAGTQQQVDVEMLKGIDRLAVAMGGKLGDTRKGYHDYPPAELSAMEREHPEDFNRLLNSYQAK